MFAGHLGVGLALKRVEPGLNVGALLLASLAPDLILGILALAGIERIIVPADYASRHYLRFVFPWSHSLLAALLLSALAFAAGALAWRGAARGRLPAAGALALAVALHWVGDWIEHPPQLPLAGAGSAMLGLGLWDRLPLAVGLETALAALGIALYLRATRSTGRPRRWGLVVLVAALTVVAALTQTGATQAPPPAALAWSWVIQIAVLTAAAAWLDRPRRRA
jgi:hypothetical protein